MGICDTAFSDLNMEAVAYLSALLTFRSANWVASQGLARPVLDASSGSDPAAYALGQAVSRWMKPCRRAIVYQEKTVRLRILSGEGVTLKFRDRDRQREIPRVPGEAAWKSSSFLGACSGRLCLLMSSIFGHLSLLIYF